MIEGARITSVGIQGQIPIEPGTDMIDLGPKVLLPGLIDAHIHLYRAGTDNLVLRSIEPPERKLIRGVADAKQLLYAGFTAARDMGFRDSVHIKRAIEEGDIEGPRLVTPGRMIVQTGGSPDPFWLPLEWVEEYDYRCRIADGVDEVRRAVREQIRSGADFVKVMASGGLTTRGRGQRAFDYSAGELQVVVEEARKAGLMVAAHALGSTAVANAVNAGADTIEHGGSIDDPTLELMAKRDVVFVPTLALTHAIARRPHSTQFDAAVRTRAEEGYEQTALTVGKAHSLGIRIAAGTDFGGLPVSTHGTNAVEARLLVDAGLTPAEAISSITEHAAEALGLRDEIGTVEVGKYADLVAVTVNPLEDIESLVSHVAFVMKGGKAILQLP
jgi:imidazolonepropionase-like amidohydrolase